MRINFFISLIVVIILGIGTILPLFYRGFFEFHDNTQVVRVFEMSKSLEEGMFPVRWVGGLGYGYGYPIFNFYGPLPYYIGGLFTLIGFSSLTATKIMIGSGMILSGITMFLLSRKYFGTFGGIVSSVLYLYFPYHAVNLYVRGAIGELYAYAFLPLVMLGLLSLISVKKINKLVRSPFLLLILPFGIFLVFISHNLTALMSIIIFLISFIVGIFFSKNKKAYSVSVVFLLLFGIALSAFYILPAFYEMNYTNVSSQVGGGADYRDHFVCPYQLWESPWGFGGSVKGCLDGLSFKLGKIHALFLFAAILALSFSLYKRKLGDSEKVTIISLVLFTVSLFFTIELSQVIYSSISYLEYIQYPWRFLNFAGLFISFGAGYIVYFISRKSERLNLPFTALAVAVVLFFSFQYFKPQEYVDYNSLRYEDKEYILFEVSKISDEYLPKGFDKPVDLSEIPNERFFLGGSSGSVKTLNDGIGRKEAFFTSDKDSYVHVNTAYFPAWKAYVNGKEETIIRANNGFNIEVEKGSGKLVLEFDQTPIEKTGNAITVLAFLTLLAVIMFSKTYAKKTS